MDSDDELVQKCQARVGSVIAGKWTLASLIGVGGMAAVYAAVHRNGVAAALKILHASFAHNDDIRGRFLREAYIANKIEHPGVVRVLDDDVLPSGEPYLVMELLLGESVEARAAHSGKKLPLDEVLLIAERTLAVLELAHAQGVVHRDLKPENLFFTEDGDVKVLDFGIARLMEGTADANRTRTGILMGTPSYMAPEQALGRWSMVDARTDIFAVGSIMFSLLAGRPVHAAPTGNEMLILAATRPAPSLAKHAEVSLEVARIVDRSLQYDQARRYPDAASMRADLVALGVSPDADTERPPPPEPAVAKPKPGSVVPPKRGSILPAPDDVDPAVLTAPTRIGHASPAANLVPRTDRPPRGDIVELYEPGFSSTAEGDALTEVFRHLDRALFTIQQYGADHPEARQRLEKVFDECQRAFIETDEALMWQVTPYAFTVQNRSLWEPRAPFDRVPYQLFADGLRVLGLLPGLELDELLGLVRIITLDRSREMAPEDDFVTLLWDADYAHVVYQAIDSFAEGDQAARGRFERDVGEVVALAHFDTSFQLEECWGDHKGKGRPAAARDADLLRLLSLPDTADPEANARADALRLREIDFGPATGDSPLHVEMSTLRELSRTLVSSLPLSDRFLLAIAAAYRVAQVAGIEASVTTPLRSTVDQLSGLAPERAIELLSGLSDAFDAGEPLGAKLVGEVLSERTTRAIFKGALGEIGGAGVFVKGLETILTVLDDTHIRPALEILPSVSEGPLKELLVGYVARVGEGHEAELAALFEEAELDLGLALIRVLARIGTPGAKNAIASATKSRHAVVRIEALGHMEGVSSERLRLELRALLEDPSSEVRIAALRAMHDHAIRVAGPFLVLRIKAPGFDRLDYEERRQSLHTLSLLAPSRAEAVCLELLAEARMVTSEAHEETRALAAEVLGTVASTPESMAALENASTARWKNSERVRISATHAKERAVIRLSQHPAPPLKERTS
jgi:serine/threonine protein kinase